MEQVGNWAFILGLVLVVIGAFVGIPQLTLILVILGLIVGFLNVTAKETTAFLVAAIALIAAGGANLDAIAVIGSALTDMLRNLAVFVAPAAIVVAVKAVYSLAGKK